MACHQLDAFAEARMSLAATGGALIEWCKIATRCDTCALNYRAAAIIAPLMSLSASSNEASASPRF